MDSAAPSDLPALTIVVRPGYRWVVIRTKPRCEKKFQVFCEQHAIQCYLPLRRHVRRYQGRVRESMIPLFTGYVFAQPELEQQAGLSECRHAAGVLAPDSIMEAQLVRELGDVRRLELATMAGEIEVSPEIKVGRLVLIKSGPLAGVTGIVTRRKNRVRLTINVELVGQSVNLEADASEVEIEN